MILGTTLTYTTANLKKLRNCLESNQCIDDTRFNHKKRHPCHDLPQTCGGRKSVCPVWIRPTENLQSHPMTSFRINERRSNKYDPRKSTVNKRGTERITWRTFYIKHTKTQRTIHDEYIMKEIRIPCIGLTVVREIRNNKIQCKNNEKLVQLNNCLRK